MTPADTIEPLDSFVPFLAGTPSREAPTHVCNILPRYTITHVIGSGGCADIYRASSARGAPVAIKIPHTKFDSTIDTSVYRRFNEEAQLWKILNHPNIVRFLLADEQPIPHIVMELMEGGSLRGLLRKRELMPGEAIYVMQQVLEGLSYAHKMATVHRDIKPENILFTADGTAKITDWGIGKFMISTTLTKTSRAAGTMFYSAPEQFDRKRFGKVDWQTDIFQLGVVFYEMLTGMNPFAEEDVASIMGKVIGFEPEHPSGINPLVPDILDEVVMGALCKSKEERWSSADVMLFQLKNAISGKTIVTRRRGLPTVMGKVLSVKEMAHDLKMKLDSKMAEVEEMDLDLGSLEPVLNEVERYMSMGWYEEAISSSDRALGAAHELHMNAMRELSRRRAELRGEVKMLFKKVFARKMEADHLYGMNREAKEAMEEGDLAREEELNEQLKRELEGLLAKYKERLGEEMLTHEAVGMVARAKKRAALYGLDVGDANRSIKKAFSLLQKGKYGRAREQYGKALGELEGSIRKHEKAEREGRKEQYREIWYRSRKKLSVSTMQYVKKLLVNRRERVRNVLEERKNFLGMSFVKIPGKDYYVARYPVTQKDWRSVMGNKPWEARRYGQSDDDAPAVFISWHAAREFVERLNEMEGVDRYAMPTEEQWEHACRGGSGSDYSFGDDVKSLGEFAWYRENTWNSDEKHAHPVGRKLPNPWGIYDVHGNVWEWCSDRYDEKEPARVIKGGSWDDQGEYCQCSARHGSVPEDENDDVGLRVIRYE